MTEELNTTALPDDLVTGLARLVLAHGAPLVKEAVQALWPVTR